ncbi:hypothetical protein ATI61_10427 [Archangium gephyra]|uniref:Uncharacterized protein n=1 Tax=Archangium gephyra TaxID=48 RepID=A0AAC8Q561_9BACT|nr:hypothetical protein [Archangium gephyra]AKJ00563.1 Hypothetical protein AA314_02189 [Archangium gephyra]REG32740.1 hypothetical protein ATI61_10427 [Archangium gephyra]
MPVRNLIQLVLLVVPVVWAVWNFLGNKRRSWRMGLALFAGGTALLLMGVGLLFGRSYPPARSLHRSEGRLTYVETYEAVLLPEQMPPIPIPEGAQASLTQGTVTQRATKTRYGEHPERTYTLYSVLLGPPGPWQQLYMSESLDDAQARLEELKDFLRGDAPRLVISGNPDGGMDWVMLLFGLVAYLMGAGVLALPGLVSHLGSGAETPPKRGGSKRGRKGNRHRHG